MCKPCVEAKLVLRFQARIAHAFLERSIPFLYTTNRHVYQDQYVKTDFIYLKVWCESATFCQRGFFFDSPCSYVIFPPMHMIFILMRNAWIMKKRHNIFMLHMVCPRHIASILIQHLYVGYMCI